MSETMSFSSTMISLSMVETSVLKTIFGTTMKLNGSNYFLWAQAFRIFIGTQNRLTFFSFHLLI